MNQRSGTALPLRERVQEYLTQIADARNDEAVADDLDDRIGCRMRVRAQYEWLGRYVYENAHVLGMWET